MRGGKEAGGQLHQTFDECASSAGDAGPCEWVLIIIKCSHKPGTDGRDGSEGGGGHNSNNTIPNNNSSGGIVIGTSPRGSGNSLDGDDRDPIEGNGSTITTPNINSSVQPLVLQSYLGIPHGSELFQWLVDYKNKEEVDILFDLGEQNKWSEDIKSFQLEVLALIRTGNETEKKLTEDVLKAIKGDTSANLAQYLNPNAQPTEIGPASYCPTGNWDPGSDPDMLYAFGAGLFKTFTDAAWNVLIRGFEHFSHDNVEGDLIRDVFSLRGIDVPVDIANETLGEIFQVYSNNGEFQIRYESGIGGDLLQLGIDILDVVTILSPSKGGGAFLTIKGGGVLTKKALSDYLKALARGQWKTVNESMSDAAKSYQEFISKRRWNESFEMPGPVKFDGIKNGILVEAKSGHLNFVDQATGTFKPFFTGQNAIINQARRQRQAAGDLPIEWHFEHDIVRRAFKDVLEDLPYNIKLIHTPR